MVPQDITGQRATILLLLAVSLAACQQEEPWPYESAQIDVPEGFKTAARVSLRGQHPFPDRSVFGTTAWELHRSGDVSQILMTRIEGSTSPFQADSAVAKLRQDNPSWSVDDPVIGTLAARPSWAWSTIVPSDQGGIWATAHTVVVSYPDSTYVMTFWGQHLEWQDVARMDAALGSFRIPVPKAPLRKQPLIVLALMLVAAGVYVWRRPPSEPAKPLPSTLRLAQPGPKPVPENEPPADVGAEPAPGETTEGFDPATIETLV